MSATLYGLRQSVWTERAAWALDHHRIAYHYHEHLPLVGEALLRLKAGVKKASVPLFADGGDVVMGSAAIARRAEAHGAGAKLFADVRVDYWNDVAETMANVGRASFFAKVLASPAAQRELAPPFVPRVLRGLAAPGAAMVIRFLGKKWDVPTNVDHLIRTKLVPALGEVRAALAGRATLLDAFSYADIAVAATLGMIEPHASSPLRGAARAAWTIPELAATHRDLLEWRDRVYAAHRPAPR